MLISNAKRFVFIETPKTASSSMRSLLRVYEDEEHEFAKHMPAARAKNAMGAERWNNFYSFAVMREPISWLHSWYKFWSGRAKRDLLPEDRQEILNMDFDTFVRTAASHSPVDAFGSIGIQSNRFCNLRDTQLVVSRLIRFDALSDEWELLKEELKLTELDELPKRNVSRGAATLPELDRQTLSIVREKWQKDFDVYERLVSGQMNT